MKRLQLMEALRMEIRALSAALLTVGGTEESRKEANRVMGVYQNCADEIAKQAYPLKEDDHGT